MTVDDNDNIQEFHGVYLLYCTNPKYKGRTYIGYTVNPQRRIKQHNDGQQAGGAFRTSNRGPWEMVLIVHGFPTAIAGLRFEWAWQHPRKSRRLRHVQAKTSREKAFDYLIRVLSEMLRVGPWKMLPLTIRWLKQEYIQDFPLDRSPPMHMPFAYGPVTVAKRKSKILYVDEDGDDEDEDYIDSCGLCKYPVLKDEKLQCINPGCSLVSHMLCLAQRFTNGQTIIPVSGQCPRCEINVLWGDLIRMKKGCLNSVVELEENPCLEW